MKIFLIPLCLSLCWLSGCGQVGNLYLPENTTPKENKNDIYLMTQKDRSQNAPLSP